MTDRKVFILGIETSCDETAAGVVENGRFILSNVIASQSDLHARYGGVVPEIASRAHLENLIPVVEEALSQANIGFHDLAGVAVTRGPGLIGALLTGLSAAKALSLALEIPLLAVNHLEAHVYANFLEHPRLQPPLVAFVVSGGHTILAYMPAHREFELLGETLDDAAGEAFDKIARFLQLGYPGGPAIDKISREGDPHKIRFPRALADDGTYNFSLSGLKTAVINYVRKMETSGGEINLPDLAASFQEAVIEVQVMKIVRAAKEYIAAGDAIQIVLSQRLRRQTKVDRVALAGGVAANRTLRDRLGEALGSEGVELYYPSRELCMDNGAMVAALGYRMLEEGKVASMEVEAQSVLPLPSKSGN